METLRTLIVCILLMSFLGCDNNETEEINNVDVDRYVELLKAAKYDSLELPNFTSKDIPSLLKYKNENQIITSFPVNMISSMGMPDCSLGMYILWTIESIRAIAIDSEYLIGRFPSQNPIVQKRKSGSNIERSNEVQLIISQAYFAWWEANKHKDFDEFKSIDPLADTEYQWH